MRARLKGFGLKATIVAKNIGYELRCADPIPSDMEYTHDLGYCAAKVRFPQLTLEPLPQEYLRLSERRYPYTSRGGAFTAEIEVDEDGLVVSYGDQWTRVTEAQR